MQLPSILRPPPLSALAQRSAQGNALLARLLALPRPRPRVAHLAGDIALVETRPLPLAALSAFEDALRAETLALPGVHEAEFNPHLRRVRFRVADGVELGPLCALIERAESACQLTDAPTAEALADERELPDDELLHVQRWVELLADLGGLSAGMLLRFVPFVPSALATNLGALVLLVRSSPRLRAPLDRRFGKHRAELLLNLVQASNQGLSSRPLSSLIDVGHRVSALRELRARTRLYQRRRADLFGARAAIDLRPEALRVARPQPPPQGPLERYDSRAWQTAAGAFGVGLITSRNLRRAGAALLGALPKPAYLGREIYANEVSRALSQRGTLVLAPDALRRLDRVDCLVIDAALLGHARFSIGGVHVRGEHDPAAIRRRVEALFEPRRPTEVQALDRDRLGPLPLLPASIDAESQAVARELAERGSLVLGLACDGQLCALCEVRIGGRRGVEDLIDAAQRGGLHVVVAGERSPNWTYHGSHPVEVMPGGDALPDGIRRLQLRGHMVCYVGLGAAPGLAHADCAVGVRDPEGPPPFAAHVICEPDLDGLHTLLRACLLARGVSKQSVNLALGAAALGALASAGAGKDGPSQRVMLVVNMAALVAMLNAMRQSAPLQGRDPLSLPDATPWHALDARAVLARLRSNPGGLDDADVDARLSAAALREREPSAPAELLAAVGQELLNPLAPLLAAGAGLSALVGSTLDAGIVAGVGGVNAVIGGVQRFRTERAIRRLVQPLRQMVRVRRAGATRVISAEDLVPGDITLLRPGEIVPADCRILECNALEIDSSILTGESLPTLRDAAPSFEAHLPDRSCMLYAGTRVVAGSATAVVVAVGDLVETRRHGRAKTVSAQGGVEERLKQLMQLTGPVAAVGGLAVVTAGLLRGRSAGELVETGVSMAVAAIPEGLPLLANAAQLAAAERLSRLGALVRNARSIEALGRVDVICLDKTGTLTEGRLELFSVVATTATGDTPVRLPDPLTANGAEPPRQVLAAALRASAIAGPIQAHPTDAALFRAASAAGVERGEGAPGLRVQNEHPFESARGYHAVLARTEHGLLLSVKGMPERLIRRCAFIRDERGALIPLTQERRAELIARAAELAARGLRVLGVAERELEPSALRPSLVPPAKDAAGNALLGSDELCFLGLLTFRDATRPAAAQTLQRLRAAGIETVMLTGDHPNTARTIAEEIGLLAGRTLITGEELGKLSDDALDARIAQCGVFARVTPGQKVRIVRALQRRGRVVAMVGDGANDAPAMRVAEAGIAVGQECAPATRAVADIVLADAAIERLLDCILEARAMWLSVRDAVSMLIGGNLGEIGFTVAGGLLAGRPPLSPRQLLLVNFLTDIAPAMAIALRRPPPEAYEQLLRGRPEELLRSRLNRTIAIRALSTGLGATWAFGIGKLTGGKARASTMALAALVGSQLGQTLLSRDAGRRVSVTAFGSAAVLAAILQTPGLSHLFGCRPLGPIGWAGALGSSAAATGVSALLSALDRRLETLAGESEPVRAVVRTVESTRKRLETRLAALTASLQT